MITIYSKDACPQCDQAIKMATAKGVAFEVKKLGIDYTKEELMLIAPTARTVPQVVSNGHLVGGLPEFQKYLVSV